MTYRQWVVVIKAARLCASFLDDVPDDPNAVSLASGLRDWADFTERWTEQRVADEGVW